MDSEMLATVRAAAEAVRRLVEACRKHAPVYRQHPQPVARINRTARWLLNAIARLHRAIPSPEEASP